HAGPDVSPWPRGVDPSSQACGDPGYAVVAVGKPVVAVSVAVERDSSARDMRRAGATATAEGVVGAGQGIDAIVVCSVRKGAQLIEEVLAVAPADDREQAVLCSGRNRTGTNVLCSGDAFATKDIAA